MSCASFLSLVEQFLSAATDTFQADSMTELATNIGEATVETCTQKQHDTLIKAIDSLYDILILLQNQLDALQAKSKTAQTTTEAGELRTINVF